MNLREDARTILATTLQAVHPKQLIESNVRFHASRLSICGQPFDLSGFRAVKVIGAGKASAALAAALSQNLDDFPAEGRIITNYGNKIPCAKFEIFEAGHPVTDANGLHATEVILDFVSDCGEDDLVICLISGGASALLEKPAAGLSLMDIQKTNLALLACGAEIVEINTVRKGLSAVKGGGLAERIFPARLVNLLISDVIGDPLHVIASGPTVPAPAADVWPVIEKYKLREKLPRSVIAQLEKNVETTGSASEKKPAEIAAKISTFLLGNNILARKTAAQSAAKLGYAVAEIPGYIAGEARTAAAQIVARIEQQSGAVPAAIIWGGETVVTHENTGKGGRNQEFVLAALQQLSPKCDTPFVLLSCGTDGRDGPTDAAGAMIDERSPALAQAKNISPTAFLQRHDSYNFFAKIDGLIKTGATGTNVMDIGIYLTGGKL